MENTELKNTWIPITCPHCGAQYLMQDIFYPDDFTGKVAANRVIKDALGKIIYVDYDEQPNYTQKFECDSCGKPFIVKAQISFKAEKEQESLDFSTTTVKLFN